LNSVKSHREACSEPISDDDLPTDLVVAAGVASGL
jgi:hypothetical protein